MRLATACIAQGLLLASTLAATGAASAATLALSGDAALDGWTLVGNSRDAGNVIWARGTNQTNFNTYLTAFTLSAADSFSGSGFAGSAGGSLVSGTWQVGDRIVGLGITSASNLSSATFKVDFGGTGTWAAAPVLDGPGGVASFAFGGNGSIQSQSLQAISNGQYSPLAQQYKNLSGVVIPAGGGIDYRSALRSWALADGSDPNAYTYNEMEWLVNYDALARLGMPLAPIGAVSKFVVNAGDDVAFTARLQFNDPSTVPEPGSLALAGAALTGMAALRRRGRSSAKGAALATAC